MIDHLRKIYPEVALWAALTLASVIFFALTAATPLHQLADGLLTTSVTLLVATTLFELAWQFVVDASGDQRAGTPRRRR